MKNEISLIGLIDPDIIESPATLTEAIYKFMHRHKDLDFDRVSGLSICKFCGKQYFDHPKDKEYDWLHKLCDGRRVKL